MPAKQLRRPDDERRPIRVRTKFNQIDSVGEIILGSSDPKAFPFVAIGPELIPAPIA